jgi:hypothetical protein
MPRSLRIECVQFSEPNNPRLIQFQEKIRLEEDAKRNKIMYNL